MGHGYAGASAGGNHGFGAMEVLLVKRQAGAYADRIGVVLTVGNDNDTWRYVNDNIDDIAHNLVRVKQMNTQSQKHVEESAQLFQRNLGPLFTLISATSQQHIMDKLSLSLKKALLLMAMERYNCNNDMMCRALGLSRGKLEKELQRCGLQAQDKNAA